jgi:hypothetical protein
MSDCLSEFEKARITKQAKESSFGPLQSGIVVPTKLKESEGTEKKTK